MHCWLTLVCALVFTPVWVNSACNRYPSSSGVDKSPVDENFAILIRNNPQNYVLGQQYNVTLNAYNGHRYIAFSLALENENGDAYASEDLGHFEIIDSVETRYSPNCGNMIESTNTNPKTRSEVTWVAPTDPNSGCVLIRATVLQHRDVWHMDDGGLTRRICQEIVDEIESRSASPECCACDEARYELTFQGNWNRNLHPKDFPPKGWITRFGDIIGAAHTVDYRFWNEGVLANEGMQEYAEHGSTRALEREFNANFKEGIIRTIIKSRGPAFPNLNGISVASVRVDPKHHLISLASKIDPSPDWFVGISGMELCLPNCTWLEERVIKLYPWDAGTDAGPSYTSPDQPQKPPDVVKRMRTNFPNDPRSPFYDETGAAMFPMATLVVKRQRLYERSCEDEDSNNVDIPRECYTHPWTPWTECSAKCGDGHTSRARVYKQPELAKMSNCDKMIERHQSRPCKGENCFGPEAALFEDDAAFMGNTKYGSHQNLAECELGPWSEWSECSKTCGEGTMFRRRQLGNRRTQEACQSATSAKLIEYKKCQGQLCLGDLNNNRRYGFGAGTNADTEEDNVYKNQAQEFNGYGNNRNFDNIQENEETDSQKYWNADNRAVPQYHGAYGKNIFRTDNEQENNDNEEPPYRSSGYDRYQAKPRINNNVGDYDNEATPYRSSGYDRYQAKPRINNNVGDNEIETLDLRVNNQPEFEIANLNRLSTDNNLRNPIKKLDNKNSRPSYINNAYNIRNAETEVNQITADNLAAELNPPLLAPGYCFQKLHVFNCLDTKVVGNFWFFNYCQNECMLFAADRCDRNENKFNTLEECEQMCQRPENEAYLKKQQATTCSPNERRRVEKRRKNKKWC